MPYLPQSQLPTMPQVPQSPLPSMPYLPQSPLPMMPYLTKSAQSEGLPGNLLCVCSVNAKNDGQAQGPVVGSIFLDFNSENTLQKIQALWQAD